MLRGTETRSRDEFENAIEQLGVNLVPACGVSSVSLGGSLLRRHTETWLDLMQETLTRPALAPQEIEKAKRELLAEGDLLWDDDAQFGRLILKQHLFEGSRYAHSTLGTHESINRIQITDIKNFIEEHYTQSRVLLGAAGQIGDDQFEKRCEAIVNSLPMGRSPQFPPPPRPRRKSTLVIANKPSRSQCQLFTGELIPGCQSGTLLPYQVGALVLGGTFSSRLIQRLRVEHGLCYGAHAWLSAERTCGGFFTHTDVDADRVDHAFNLLNETLEDYVANGPSEAEFDFAKSSILKGLPFGLETASMEVAQRVRLQLLGRNHSDLDRRRAQIEALKLSSVRKAMMTLPHHGKRVVVLVCSYDEALRQKLSPMIQDFDVVEVDWSAPSCKES